VAAPTPAPTATTVKRPSTWKWRQRPRQRGHPKHRLPVGTFTFGGQIALQNLINAGPPYPGVVSVSYGEPESVGGAGINAVFYATISRRPPRASPSSAQPAITARRVSRIMEIFKSTPWALADGRKRPTTYPWAHRLRRNYNSFKGGPALSTYWNATNTASYGSAKGYIPRCRGTIPAPTP